MKRYRLFLVLAMFLTLGAVWYYLSLSTRYESAKKQTNEGLQRSSELVASAKAVCEPGKVSESCLVLKNKANKELDSVRRTLKKVSSLMDSRFVNAQERDTAWFVSTVAESLRQSQELFDITLNESGKVLEDLEVETERGMELGRRALKETAEKLKQEEQKEKK